MTDVERFRTLLEKLIEELERGGVSSRHYGDDNVLSSLASYSETVNALSGSLGFGAIICIQYVWPLFIRDAFRVSDEIAIYDSYSGRDESIGLLRRWLLVEPSTDCSKRPPLLERQPITLQGDRLTYNGSTHTITSDQAVFMTLLIRAHGRVVSGTDMSKPPHNLGKPSGIKDRLPDEIKDIIESKTGSGHRLTCWD
jgi:hypothetical protein